MTLAPAIGAACALIGLYLSWSWDLPVGGTIVLTLTGAFLIVHLAAPRHGLVARLAA